ncbi:hypothetical protein [Pseudomonas sp. zfem002]|uniref:hypothetical protein n=1 Tax=Pseudomonas sp. zfem002 TaxID=3078197 RepID=UPI0029286696|nr:hypothetical protein [Pseudomonas sp. zfem002]MDU9389394.1 hypothetical protein [Pseudomonas sp. zfem002]
MTDSQQQDRVAQARARFHEDQLRRRAEPRMLAPLELEAGAIVDVDGTLHKDFLRNDLVVTIQEWDLPLSPGLTDTLYLEWARGHAPQESDFIEIASLEITAPVADGTFPLKSLKIPVDLLQVDGPYTLRYWVFRYNHESDYSPPLRIVCDGTRPWFDERPPALLLPEVPITDQYLAEHPQGVVATLPAYADRQPGDVVTYRWIAMPLPENPADVPIAGSAPVTGEPAQITFSADTVRAQGDGGCVVFYELMDKATNLSRLSYYTSVGVALGPLPTGLLPPQVPQAEGDNLVDLVDARLGVVVRIPAFQNAKASDRIEVTWGRTVLYAEEIGSSPVLPVQVSVPVSVLRSEYADAQGPLPTNVSYRILRGTVPFVAPAISVDVDFSVIGPPRPEPDPDWPDPINPQLDILQTRGKVSGNLDHLTRADAGQDAEQSFLAWAPLNPGEIVEFYWNNVPVPEARFIVEVGMAPGDTIAVEIPWSYIEEAGNNAQVPVHYRIGAPGSNNWQHSPTAYVNVEAIILTPAAPAFLGLSQPLGWLTCRSLYDLDEPNELDPSVRVQVPDLSRYLSDGDQLTLTWTPWNRISGGEVIEHAIKTETITLGGANPVTGFVWRVQPYATYILPTYNPEGGSRDGRAQVVYAFQMGDETVTSLAVEAVVSMHNASGSCPIPPPAN